MAHSVRPESGSETSQRAYLRNSAPRKPPFFLSSAASISGGGAPYGPVAWPAAGLVNWDGSPPTRPDFLSASLSRARLKSKWMVSSLQNDGFVESLTLGHSLGGQDDELFRGGILWEPTDNFSLRFTGNYEDKSSTDARIVRFSNMDHPQITRYNVLAGNPDYLAMARATLDRAVTDGRVLPIRATKMLQVLVAAEALAGIEDVAR